MKASNDLFLERGSKHIHCVYCIFNSLPLPPSCVSFMFTLYGSSSPASTVCLSGEARCHCREWLRRWASRTKQLINSRHSVSEWACILSSDERLSEVRTDRTATAGPCRSTGKGSYKRPPELRYWTCDVKKEKAKGKPNTTRVYSYQGFSEWLYQFLLFNWGLKLFVCVCFILCAFIM